MIGRYNCNIIKECKVVSADHMDDPNKYSST